MATVAGTSSLCESTYMTHCKPCIILQLGPAKLKLMLFLVAFSPSKSEFSVWSCMCSQYVGYTEVWAHSWVRSLPFLNIWCKCSQILAVWSGIFLWEKPKFLLIQCKMIRCGETDQATVKFTILSLHLSKLFCALSLICSCDSSSQDRQKVCGSGNSTLMPIFYLYSVVKYTAFSNLSIWISAFITDLLLQNTNHTTFFVTCFIYSGLQKEKQQHKHCIEPWEEPLASCVCVCCVLLVGSAPPISSCIKLAKDC